jgi:hypothetical protein
MKTPPDSEERRFAMCMALRLRVISKPSLTFTSGLLTVYALAGSNRSTPRMDPLISTAFGGNAGQ